MLYIEKAGLSKDMEYDDSVYPFTLPVIQKLDQLDFRKPITFLSGENGSGKSTLLEAIAIAYGFNPEGGTRNFNFSSRDTHSSLHEVFYLKRGPARAEDGFFLRAESFYNLASEIDNLDKVPLTPPYLKYYGGVSLHEVSHGEGFLNLVLNRFQGNGLYIMDEPESALSPTGQFALLSWMYQLSIKSHSQFIIATHSPILMSCPNAEILEVHDDGEIISTPYKETLNYILYKRFLNDERMLEELLKEEA